MVPFVHHSVDEAHCSTAAACTLQHRSCLHTAAPQLLAHCSTAAACTLQHRSCLHTAAPLLLAHCSTAAAWTLQHRSCLDTAAPQLLGQCGRQACQKGSTHLTAASSLAWGRQVRAHGRPFFQATIVRHQLSRKRPVVGSTLYRQMFCTLPCQSQLADASFPRPKSANALPFKRCC